MPPLSDRPSKKWDALPTSGTLAKYGLTVEAYLAICRRQRWLCPVCGEQLAGRPLAIDHEHVKGFKARVKRRGRNGKMRRVRVMPPEVRRTHVRGVLHSFCNRQVRKWLTLDLAVAIVEYLRAHESRKSSGKMQA